MCGRFAQFSKISVLEEFFEAETFVNTDTPFYNAAPGHELLAVIYRDGKRRMGRLRWGLVPFWAKDEKIGYKMINARIETIDKKTSFKNAFASKRCIIPADGFFEWKKKGSKKKPYYFHSPESNPLAFAGIWESWTRADGSKLFTFSIITTSAKGTARDVHDRMPVILPLSTLSEWLMGKGDAPNDQAGHGNLATSKAFLEKVRITQLNCFAVSQHVNSTKNNDLSCIEEIANV